MRAMVLEQAKSPLVLRDLPTPQPKAGELPLPQDMVRGVLQGDRRWRVVRHEDGGLDITVDQTDPRSRPLDRPPRPPPGMPKMPSKMSAKAEPKSAEKPWPPPMPPCSKAAWPKRS